MIADRLRAAILQAAISGKLTDQRPEDGTATELLEQIAAERAALIKAGKLKKQKPLPPVSEEERPFALPSSWIWVRLGDYAHDRGQQAPQVPFTYIDISAIDNRKQTLDRANLAVLSPEAAPSRARRTALPGDVIYSTVRPYLHNACILPGGLRPEPIVSTGLAVLTTGHIVANRLLLNTMLSPYFDELANRTDNSRGVAYPAINDTQLRKLPVPVPPLAEQERIVAKLEEVLPLIDQLAELEREREHLDREFAKAIERAILQAAISGKLTKQLPEDGTATELLETITAERRQLEKEGKIKKQKPLPPVDKADEPFELPDNWQWTRLGELFSVKSGKATSLEKRSGHYTVPVYGGNGIAGYTENAAVRKDTLVIGRVGFYCGCVHVTESEAWISDNALEVTAHSQALPVQYWQYLLSHLNLGETSVSTAQPVVSGKRMYPVAVPVPPVGEQERIAAKLNRALPLAREIGGLVS
ncbi:restriction endonuclease subunit S [Trueperella pyogenes]|uniref:restriction endonuclease subunit S n=1 Tax=Trueperella pyogenes TaxID=1661 RepID=UPI00345D4B25